MIVLACATLLRDSSVTLHVYPKIPIPQKSKFCTEISFLIGLAIKKLNVYVFKELALWADSSFCPHFLKWDFQNSVSGHIA